jgi:hypothetical protein
MDGYLNDNKIKKLDNILLICVDGIGPAKALVRPLINIYPLTQWLNIAPGSNSVNLDVWSLSETIKWCEPGRTRCGGSRAAVAAAGAGEQLDSVGVAMPTVGVVDLDNGWWGASGRLAVRSGGWRRGDVSNFDREEMPCAWPHGDRSSATSMSV